MEQTINIKELDEKTRIQREELIKAIETFRNEFFDQFQTENKKTITPQEVSIFLKKCYDYNKQFNDFMNNAETLRDYYYDKYWINNSDYIHWQTECVTIPREIVDFKPPHRMDFDIMNVLDMVDSKKINNESIQIIKDYYELNNQQFSKEIAEIVNEAEKYNSSLFGKTVSEINNIADKGYSIFNAIKEHCNNFINSFKENTQIVKENFISFISIADNKLNEIHKQFDRKRIELWIKNPDISNVKLINKLNSEQLEDPDINLEVFKERGKEIYEIISEEPKLKKQKELLSLHKRVSEQNHLLDKQLKETKEALGRNEIPEWDKCSLILSYENSLTEFGYNDMKNNYNGQYLKNILNSNIKAIEENNKEKNLNTVYER